MIKLTGVSKIRVDSYYLDLDWNEIQNIIRERVEAKLSDPEFMGGEAVQFRKPIRFTSGEIEITMRQLEEGSPSYRVNKFAARVEVHLPPPGLPVEPQSGN